MKIKISKQSNIERMLNMEQGKSSARIINYEKLILTIKDVEKELRKLKIPKKYWEGIIINIGPDLYQIKGSWGKMCSFATLEFENKNWKLVKASREMRWKKSAHDRITYEVETTLSDLAKSKIGKITFDFD